MSATGAGPLRCIAVRNLDSNAGAVRRPLNFIDAGLELLSSDLSDLPERGSAPEDCPQDSPEGTDKVFLHDAHPDCLRQEFEVEYPRTLLPQPTAERRFHEPNSSIP